MCEVEPLSDKALTALAEDMMVNMATFHLKDTRTRELITLFRRTLATVEAQKKEIARLRLLIRNEQTEPPFDVTDDMTTEFAVTIAELKQRIEELEKALKYLRFERVNAMGETVQDVVSESCLRRISAILHEEGDGDGQG